MSPECGAESFILKVFLKKIDLTRDLWNLLFNIGCVQLSEFSSFSSFHGGCIENLVEVWTEFLVYQPHNLYSVLKSALDKLNMHLSQNKMLIVRRNSNKMTQYIGF